VDGVAKTQQIFGQISAVLPGNPREERDAPLRILNRHIHSNNAKTEHIAQNGPVAGKDLRPDQTLTMPPFAP
jgi:hypothetical protein